MQHAYNDGQRQRRLHSLEISVGSASTEERDLRQQTASEAHISRCIHVERMVYNERDEDEISWFVHYQRYDTP